jgi:glyoxylase-like metal-dependent hydrolase (beta-lactamase superfamily II)
VIDPGPAFDDHLDAVAAEIGRRGGAGGIALTHDHEDHAEGVAGLRERLGGPPVAAYRFPAEVRLRDGSTFGPLEAVAVPGHADDHLAFVADRIAFTGDAVLGQGSVFVTSRLAEYMAALERLRARPLALICPGHGPPVEDPAAKLTEYLEHRQEREDKLVAALEAGLRTEDELLDTVWADAPPQLRQAAAVTLSAHIGKLRDEGRF